MEDPSLAIEVHLYRLNQNLKLWIDDAHRESGLIRDRFTVIIIREAKAIYEHKALTPTIAKKLSALFLSLGFEQYTAAFEKQASSTLTKNEDKELSFDFIKLVRSKTQKCIYEWMAITENPGWLPYFPFEMLDRS